MSLFPTPRCFGSLMERMEKAGFDEAFVRKGILPDWWTGDCDRDPNLLPDFEFMVARFLRMPLAGVRDPAVPLRIPELGVAQMGVSVSFPAPDAPDPFEEAGIVPTVIYGASMIDPIPTFDEVLDYMRCYGGTLQLRATVPGGAVPVCNIPAEVAIFAAPTCPGGCMVWGRGDIGWRGQWIHARQTWRRWLADPWTEAEVWAEMGWPE